MPAWWICRKLLLYNRCALFSAHIFWCFYIIERVPIESILGCFSFKSGTHDWNSSCHYPSHEYSGSRVWYPTLECSCQEISVLSKNFRPNSEEAKTVMQCTLHYGFTAIALVASIWFYGKYSININVGMTANTPKKPQTSHFQLQTESLKFVRLKHVTPKRVVLVLYSLSLNSPRHS